MHKPMTVQSGARIANLELELLRMGGYHFWVVKQNGRRLSTEMTIREANGWMNSYLACLARLHEMGT